MIDIYEEHNVNLLSVEPIKKEVTDQYGVIEVKNKKTKNLYEISSIVEKPSPATAKSNLGVVGRYILSPNIFKMIEASKPGSGNEIQLTDAIAKLMKQEDVMAFEFDGKRFDCGSKIGYLKASVEYALEHDEVSKEFESYLKNLEC